jgi:hypothetical protein
LQTLLSKPTKTKTFFCFSLAIMYVGVCIAERILKRPDVERKKEKGL